MNKLIIFDIIIILKKGDGHMNNFERLRQCEDEYEMSDLISGYICNNLHKLKNKDGTFNGLEILRWLQSNKNIFGEERE